MKAKSFQEHLQNKHEATECICYNRRSPLDPISELASKTPSSFFSAELDGITACAFLSALITLKKEVRNSIE